MKTQREINSRAVLHHSHFLSRRLLTSNRSREVRVTGEAKSEGMGLPFIETQGEYHNHAEKLRCLSCA